MYQSCENYSCINGAVTLHNQVILDFTIDIKHRDQGQYLRVINYYCILLAVVYGFKEQQIQDTCLTVIEKERMNYNIYNIKNQ
jgi:hypothetical protein